MGEALRLPLPLPGIIRDCERSAAILFVSRASTDCFAELARNDRGRLGKLMPTVQNRTVSR
jgi:hypothetical protein